MNLENKFSKSSQAQKDTRYMSSLRENVQTRQIYKDRYSGQGLWEQEIESDC